MRTSVAAFLVMCACGTNPGSGGSSSAITVTPLDGQAEYGLVEIGTTAEKTFEITNEASSSAGISVAITGQAFTLQSTTCGVNLGGNLSCTVVVRFAPQALAAATGSLNIDGDMPTTQQLLGTGAYRVTVSADADVSAPGSGSITSSPAGIDCNGGSGTCSALFADAVILTATPGASSVLTGWSEPSCGIASTCTVQPSVTPVDIHATFRDGATGTLTIMFAGHGHGTVIVTGGGVSESCTDTCVISAPVGTVVSVREMSSDIWSGFSGGCTAAPPLDSCTLTIGYSSTSVATFDADPKELWSLEAPDFGHAVDVAFDSHDNVIVATNTTITKRAADTGAAIWTISVSGNVGGIAVGPDDQVYAGTDATLKAFDTDGNALWSAGSIASCVNSRYNDVDRPITVAPNGDILITDSGLIAAYSPSNGALLRTYSYDWQSLPNFPATICYVSTDSSGTVYQGLDNTDAGYFEAGKFSAAGTYLGYTGPLNNSSIGNYVVNATSHVGSGSYGPNVYLTGAVTAQVHHNVLLPAWNAVARAGADYVWAMSTTEYDSDHRRIGLQLLRLNSTGAVIWSFTNPGVGGQNWGGWVPWQIAGSPSGRFAIVGGYRGSAADDQDAMAVQVYGP